MVDLLLNLLALLDLVLELISDLREVLVEEGVDVLMG